MIDSTKNHIKNQFKKEAQKNPSKHYPVFVLKKKGFSRKQCRICKTYFWTCNNGDDVCGDAKCRGKYSFINKKTIKPIGYIDVWKKFSAFFKKLNYTQIEPYPTVARWRDDMDFTIASIADFQPYVVAGEIEPPANPLVIPQFCMRFSDIDNVGITGRHYTGFTMIGQHAFEKQKNYDQDKYFCNLFDWFGDIGLNNKDLIIHEDSWLGGGNMGPSVEFFSGGLELANQVYMKYNISSGTPKKMDINVLDMGLGQERIAWYGNNQNGSYEAVFEKIIKYLNAKGIVDKTNNEEKNIISSFLPYSGIFDFDENQNTSVLWRKIAGKIGIEKEILQNTILKKSAFYSILDHSRTILMALSDGALFSNTGGGYNLRVLFRRIKTLSEKYKYNIDFMTLIEKHKNYLKEQYHGLNNNFDEIEEIIKNEDEKYKIQKSKTKDIIHQMKKKYKNIVIKEKDIITLYQSKGIEPVELEKNKLIKAVPQDFYSKVSQIHESKKSKKDNFEFKDITKNMPLTLKTYEFDWKSTETVSCVLKSKDNFIICDKTCFYATSGGQENDKGEIYDKKNKIANIIDAININGIIIHKLDRKVKINSNKKVCLKVDKRRRMSIAFNHTSTHIINAAAREVLGNHIWQCGSYNDEKKARLDITHYQLLRKEQLQKIEDIANCIIEKNIPVKIEIIMRNTAEKKYGFRIYQGGAVPQKKLRIVKIGNIDIEACGGTHIDRTGMLKIIKIIEQKKIQDGVVRIVFSSGNSALDYIRHEENILNECCQILNVEKEHAPKTAKRFFDEWKKQKKEIRKLKKQIRKKS